MRWFPTATGTGFGAACRRAELTAWLVPAQAWAGPASASPLAPARDLADLSLDELANLQVTSVSRQRQSLGDAPASVHVITQEDIRRSGANTLPEALRLAPNLQVARVDARNYAVAARGFNGVFANKLLVLVDGRSVYTPLFSGVLWDTQEVMLQDIDRIEVISGPGATLWGANAVNGVINVITREAGRTQGGLVSLGAGGDDRRVAARHGAALAQGRGHYRVHAQSGSGAATGQEGGAPAADGWRRSQAGFRADLGEAGQGVTLQGDLYSGRLDQNGARDIHLSGFNLAGQVDHRLGAGSALQARLAVDQTVRHETQASERLDTFEASAQHSLAWGERQQLVWGGSYRLSTDRLRNNPGFAFLPASLDLHWASLFAQDELALRPGLNLTAGWRLEHNNYTGFESMPSLRLAWKPAEGHLAWAAASRAIRTPSRVDRDLQTASPPFAGEPGFRSEVARTLEAGYRGQPLPTLTYAVTAFHSEYDRLRSLELNAAGTGLTFGNHAEGRNRGVEMWGLWQALPAWRVSAGWVAQHAETHHLPGATLPTVPLDDADPRRHGSLRVSGELPGRTELDVIFRAVGKLRRPEVPAYRALDLRLGWRLRRDLELSVLGKNLLDAAHPEFLAAPNRSQFERGVFVNLVWRRP